MNLFTALNEFPKKLDALKPQDFKEGDAVCLYDETRAVVLEGRFVRPSEGTKAGDCTVVFAGEEQERLVWRFLLGRTKVDSLARYLARAKKHGEELATQGGSLQEAYEQAAAAYFTHRGQIRRAQAAIARVMDVLDSFKTDKDAARDIVKLVFGVDLDAPQSAPAPQAPGTSAETPAAP